MSNKTMATVDHSTQKYRLPVHITPEIYEIKLSPDLKNFTFAGEETISIIVHQEVNEIVLNAKEIQIQQSTIEQQGKTFTGTATLDPVNERVIISLPENLQPGKASVNLKFTGVLNDKLKGFYRSSYKDLQGNNKTLATTQFESTDARRAFPCWDEPEHKAIFRIILIVDEHLTAISNASIKTEKKLPGGKKEVSYVDTMKMSTYLVAFIVGEFEGTDPVFVDGKPIKVWSLSGKRHLSKFALDCAKFCLTHFSDYYGIPYPGDKLDLIAIPDFAAGAMENLGAVTFRETALLVNEESATHAELERVADVVAHELAHMWFGDLVTMKWWNGLWLNEAFATFMEMLAVDAWKPHWKRWDTFAVSRAAAFSVDGLKSTRPIEFPVKHPDEAGAMFDILTYEKGASVLRMLEQYLGIKEFRKGISNYLQKHKYANAETTDLWDAIEETCHQPIRHMMDTWIFQGGYPLISVDLDSTTNSISLTQQLFLYLNPKEHNGQTQLFEVPIMLRAKTNKGEITKKFILDQPKMKIELPGKVEWVVINDGGHGFYRVRYSKELLSSLTPKLWQTLGPIERFNLVSDTWASVVAGHTKLAEYLQLASTFSQEEDKNVWSILIGSLHYINKVIDDGYRNNLEIFTRKLTDSAYKRLGWTPAKSENELTRQLRGMIIATRGVLGNDPQTQKQARELYDKYKKDKSSVDPNIVPALVGILAYTGDKNTYEEFHQEYKQAKTPQEEQRYLFSLASFREKDLINQTLKQTISGEVRTQNAPYLVQAVMSNTYGRELGWQFMQDNWETMLKLFPENAISRMCEGITNLVNKTLEKDVQEFFKTHPVKQGEKAIEQHLEKLRIAVLLKEREKANFSVMFNS